MQKPEEFSLTSLNRYHKDGTLPTNAQDIFVFGSNLAGIHGAGAAKVARDQFGAPLGAGCGYMGNAYAIPTKDKRVETMDLFEINKYVKHFIYFTQLFPERTFFVTRVGCGLAGYSDSQIALMFIGAKNCSFAEQWKPYLEINNGL
jgi:hypothetical protein